MEQLNIHRFGKVISRLFIINHKTLFKIFLGYAILFLLYSLISMGIFSWEELPDLSIVERLMTVLTIVGPSFAIGSYFFSCAIISDLEGKQKRINEMMLPATNLEKYLARLVYVIIGFPLLVLAALVAADVLQQLVSLIIPHGGRASLCSIAIGFLNPSNFDPESLFIMITGYLFVNSYCVLSGMLFGKNAWIKGGLMGMSLLFLLSGIMLGLAYIFTDHFYIHAENVGWEYSDTVGNIIAWVLTLLMYALAYRVYMRLQVINNRWINW